MRCFITSDFNFGRRLRQTINKLPPRDRWFDGWFGSWVETETSPSKPKSGISNFPHGTAVNKLITHIPLPAVFQKGLCALQVRSFRTRARPKPGIERLRTTRSEAVAGDGQTDCTPWEHWWRSVAYHQQQHKRWRRRTPNGLRWIRLRMGKKYRLILYSNTKLDPYQNIISN